MSDPSSQLLAELERSVEDALRSRRPILSHINADTTWLLSFAYPEDAICPSGRCRFNVLIDPWLKDVQCDVASWFSKQWHKIPSSVQTIQELNEVIGAREELEFRSKDDSSRMSSEDIGTSNSPSGNYLDAVVCSHEFTDHCHRPTLEEIDPTVPCIATSKAAELIRSWNHFDQVFEVSAFGNGSDWRKTSATPLPSWLGVARLVSASDAFYFHSAIAIFCKETESEDSDTAEAVIYTPHGINPDDLGSIPRAFPPVRTLALLHGLHDVSITLTKQLNLGAYNALKCQQFLNPRYWVSTHDEIKVGGGLIAPFLRRRAYTLQDILKSVGNNSEAANLSVKALNHVELASGETLTLM